MDQPACTHSIQLTPRHSLCQDSPSRVTNENVEAQGFQPLFYSKFFPTPPHLACSFPAPRPIPEHQPPRLGTWKDLRVHGFHSPSGMHSRPHQTTDAEQKLGPLSSCHSPPSCPAAWEPGLACVALVCLFSPASVTRLCVAWGSFRGPCGWAP